MTTKALKGDVARMRRKWEKWEGLWLRYWRLPEAWGYANLDVTNEERIQWHTDRLVRDFEEKNVSCELGSMWQRAIIEADLRESMKIPIEPTEIDSTRLERLPWLVIKLSEVSRGNYLKLRNRLDQAYKFTPPGLMALGHGTERSGSRDSDLKFDKEGGDNKKSGKSKEKTDKTESNFNLLNMLLIRYPKNIEKEAYETRDYFSNIEEQVNKTFRTPEYIDKALKDFTRLIKEECKKEGIDIERENYL